MFARGNMDFANDIFKFKRFNHEKLLKYGFKFNGVYQIERKIDQFLMKIEIKNGLVRVELIDGETGEPFTLFNVVGAQGGYVQNLRSECEKVLKDIAEKCCEQEIFKSDEAKKVIEHIRKKYGDELEFLWDKFPENAICRRKDNKKWYVAFIRLPKNKLSLNGTEKVDILDVRSDEVEKLIDNKTILPAYHMNKKNWVTILLDGNGDLKTVYDLVDKSCLLAKKK